MKLSRLILANRRPDGSRYDDYFILPGAERVEAFARSYYPVEQVIEVDACGYDIGASWHPARCGQPEPCPEHGDERCVECGEPAKEACSFAGSFFVCGRPLCTEHKGNCGRHG